jgi:Flp pilus assembly pilin Flp
MLRFLKCRKGQNTAEYAILIGLVVAGVMSMQVFVKREIQGVIKKGTDMSSGGANRQYEPYYLESKYDNTAKAYTDTEQVHTGHAVTRTFASEQAPKVTERTGYQKQRAYDGQDVVLQDPASEE